MTEQIVVLLIQERDRLNRAIEALQGPVKRRGRPPKDLLPLTSNGVSKKNAPKRRGWTPQQKQAAALRMKKRWAAKKKAS